MDSFFKTYSKHILLGSIPSDDTYIVFKTGYVLGALPLYNPRVLHVILLSLNDRRLKSRCIGRNL